MGTLTFSCLVGCALFSVLDAWNPFQESFNWSSSNQGFGSPGFGNFGRLSNGFGSGEFGNNLFGNGVSRSSSDNGKVSQPDASSRTAGAGKNNGGSGFGRFGGFGNGFGSGGFDGNVFSSRMGSLGPGGNSSPSTANSGTGNSSPGGSGFGNLPRFGNGNFGGFDNSGFIDFAARYSNFGKQLAPPLPLPFGRGSSTADATSAITPTAPKVEASTKVIPTATESRDDDATIAERLTDAMGQPGDEEAFVKALLKAASNEFDEPKKRYNYMVFNTENEYDENFKNVVFFHSFPFKEKKYFLWVFERGTSRNRGHLGWYNWGFSGQVQRPSKEFATFDKNQ